LTGLRERDSGENSDKTPVPATIEYKNQRRPQIRVYTDRRKLPTQRLLTAPHVDSNNFEDLRRHGKVHQIQFKITPFAHKVGEEVAALFGMSLSQYTKALLYLNLGLIFEPVDRRRKKK